MGDRGRKISEFETSLIYREGPRTARATQRNPVSGERKKKRILGYYTNLIFKIKR